MISHDPDTAHAVANVFPPVAVHSHCEQHVRRVDRAGTARGTTGRVNAGMVECDEQRLSFESGERNVQDAGYPRAVRRVQVETLGELIAQRADARDFFGATFVRDAQCRCKRDDARNVLRSSSKVAFVTTAFDQRHEACAVADNKRANALRSTELVTRDRDEIDSHGRVT